MSVLLWSSIIRAIALMMEAARTSETLVNFYQTTQRYNPEDSHLHYVSIIMEFLLSEQICVAAVPWANEKNSSEMRTFPNVFIEDSELPSCFLHHQMSPSI
jgi:hypothetical protein